MNYYNTVFEEFNLHILIHFLKGFFLGLDCYNSRPYIIIVHLRTTVQ